MFDWFNKGKEPSNVVPFPELKEIPKMPYIVPSEPKEEPTLTYYRLGRTNNNRVSLQIGLSEITMNKEGVQNLIEQLNVFMNQLSDEDHDDAS